MERYKSKREVIQDFQQQLMQMERSLSMVNGEESEKLQSVQILQGKLHQLGSEISQLEGKKDRAKKSITRSAAEFHKKVGADPKEILPEERDFVIRKARELGSLVLTEIARLLEKYPNVTLSLGELCAQVSFSCKISLDPQ